MSNRNSEVLYTVADRDGLGLDRIAHSLDIGQYPAGDPMVKDGHVPSRVLLRPRSLETFFATLFWVDALVDRGYAAPHLILPCVPGARQDRLLEGAADQLLTIKSIARELNMREFPTVTVLDPHSHVTSALINRCRVVPSVEVFRGIQNAWDGIIAPDGGAEKRAESVAQLYGLPLFHAWKIRDTQTGKLTGFGCEPIPSRHRSLLMVDDICDGGGTFIGLADHLTAKTSAMLSLFTTHGYYSNGIEALDKRFSRILTTDSVLPAAPATSPIVATYTSSYNLLIGGFV